jgi:GNAT superfamily N-acetyltransferase
VFRLSSGLAKTMSSAALEIRPFRDADGTRVRELFIEVNRLLSPAELRGAFEAYIERALADEIDRIEVYYAEHGGAFWVATLCGGLVGMFGLERASDDAMELRRMYVNPAARQLGIGRRMLLYAEAECRRRGFKRLELSTAEIQTEAIALYRSGGYRLIREELAEHGSNKTVGSGVRRPYFEKPLSRPSQNNSRGEQRQP